MLIMEYAVGGDLHNHLQKNFNNITWEKKLYILQDILQGYLYFLHINYIFYSSMY